MSPPVARHVVVTRGSRASRRGLGASLALFVMLAVLPSFAGSSVTNDLTQLIILAIMAVAWNLLAGYAGLISVGQQAFIGLGAYCVLYLADHGVQAWVAVPIAMAFAGVAALPLSFIAFRMRGGYFAVGTWVIAEVFRLAVSQVQSLGGGAGASLNDLDSFDPTTRLAVTYWVCLAVLAVVLLSSAVLLRSRFGLSLMSVRDDELAADAVGIDVARTKRLVYLVSAVACGGVGALLLVSALQVSPNSIFSVQYSAFMIFMVIVGGTGTFEGPLVGAVIFYGLEQLLANYGVWYLIILGAVAVSVTLWLPRGLLGTVARVRDISILPLRHSTTIGDVVASDGEFSLE